MKLMFEINKETLQDLVNLSIGLFKPLNGFVNRENYNSIINNYSLVNGSIWTIPITLDVDEVTFNKQKIQKELLLTYENSIVAKLIAEDKFIVNSSSDILKIFKTNDISHPGVFQELSRNRYRIAGKPVLLDESLLENSLNPQKIKNIFKEKGWKTVVGFQTRNPVHKAHEYLQRIGLEICDGLFINPLIGWKKDGDFSEEVINESYGAMIKNYYPKERVYFDVLKTPMRYAGPREAIFHALIRKNLGCTHFIIGRDHAGVGGFYGKYDAQELAIELRSKFDMGIELLLLGGPYYCEKCEQIVTEKSCGHDETFKQEISGTLIRKIINEGKNPEHELMRPEVLEVINNISNIFIG